MAITVENPIVWNNAIKDTDSILNTTNGVITLPRIGYYDIRCIAYYNGTAAFGSLSIIDGTTLTRLIRIDFRGNIVNALPLSGSALFFCSVANTQIRLSISDLGVAGTLTNEATVTSRNFAHVSVSYLGIDT
jgi:hypothetical protein